MTRLSVVMHPSHLGTVVESYVEGAVRLIGLAFGDLDKWPEKYGCEYENDVFMMHPECWCEKNDGSCLWCLHGDHPDFRRLLYERFGTVNYPEYANRHYYDPPHFWFKPSNFRLSWYKYIGREMVSNKDEIPGDFLRTIFETHPAGMTIKDAVDLMKHRMRSDTWLETSWNTTLSTLDRAGLQWKGT